MIGIPIACNANKDEDMFEVTATITDQPLPSKFSMQSDSKTFLGKCTRKMISTNCPTICPRRLCKSISCSAVCDEIVNEMKKEAKHRVLSQFFEEVYGYTVTTDITVDELNCPIIFSNQTV